MTLTQHLVVTGIAAAALAPGSSAGELLLFCSGGVLIDVDHLIFYAVRTGKWDIPGMFRYFREEIDPYLDRIPYLGVCIFHTAECFLAVALAALFFPPCRYLLAGMILHLLLDIFDLIRLKVPFIRAYSLVEHLIRRRTPGYPFR
jgi:hypothetical protein